MLKEKVALVTGGGTGIGKSTSMRLSGQGAIVVVNYSRSAREAKETVEEIMSSGGTAFDMRADVSKDSEVRQMVKAVVERFGRLDILVNNAGVTDFVAHDDLEGLSEEYWDRAVAVNVKGTFFCCRAAAPHLRAHRGCIVNVASIAGMTGLGSSIAYCASKAGVISVTKSLARVLAPEVRVNSVSPGIVLTRWVDGKEDHVERLSKGTPMQRACNADDVSEVILCLVQNAGMMTGQNVVVDGGMFLGG